MYARLLQRLRVGELCARPVVERPARPARLVHRRAARARQGAAHGLARLGAQLLSGEGLAGRRTARRWRGGAGGVAAGRGRAQGSRPRMTRSPAYWPGLHSRREVLAQHAPHSFPCAARPVAAAVSHAARRRCEARHRRRRGRRGACAACCHCAASCLARASSRPGHGGPSDGGASGASGGGGGGGGGGGAASDTRGGRFGSVAALQEFVDRL